MNVSVARRPWRTPSMQVKSSAGAWTLPDTSPPLSVFFSGVPLWVSFHLLAPPSISTRTEPLSVSCPGTQK